MERIHTATLYCYVEPQVAAHARRQGGAKFGTFSNFVNYLIAKDAGDKKAMQRALAYAKASYEPSVRVKTKKVAKKTAKKTKAKKKIASIRQVTLSAPQAA